MTLIPGTRLGPYEIQSPLGSGGMGEVYRARDTRLHRSVALKVIAGLSSDDPERLMRFGREAQLLASLNHPRIAQIYGFEDCVLPGNGHAAVPALVMELVEGPLPADLPDELYRLMRRCLERDPKNRLRDAADARIVIDEVIADLARIGRAGREGREGREGRSARHQHGGGVPRASVARRPWLAIAGIALIGAIAGVSMPVLAG